MALPFEKALRWQGTLDIAGCAGQDSADMKLFNAAERMSKARFDTPFAETLKNSDDFRVADD